MTHTSVKAPPLGCPCPAAFILANNRGIIGVEKPNCECEIAGSKRRRVCSPSPAKPLVERAEHVQRRRLEVEEHCQRNTVKARVHQHDEGVEAKSEVLAADRK
jgi:hypothetical protein